MIALGTDTDGHERLARRRRYRWGYVGSLLAGMAGLFGATWLGYPLLGIALYWLGAGAMLAILWGSPIELFDEREQWLERKAATLTLGLVGIAGIVAIPGVVALEEAGFLTIPAWAMGAIYGFVALYAVFGLLMLVLSRR